MPGATEFECRVRAASLPEQVQQIHQVQEALVGLDRMMELSSRLQQQRDRWYRCWKWTFGGLLVSVIGHLAWILGRLW